MDDKQTVSKLTYCSPKHKFVYLAVPKTASSSIVSWLLKLEGLQWNDEDKKNNRYRIVQRHLRLVQHPGLQGSFKFTIIRNPLSRLVSAYLDKFVGGGHIPAASVMKRLGKGTEGISFREFIDYLAHADLKNVDAHWMPQAFLIDIFRPDMLGILENLQPFLHRVGAKIGIPVDIGWDRKTLVLCKQDCGPIMDIASSELKGRNPVLVNFYDEDITAVVNRLFNKDFALWEKITNRK